MIDAPVSISEWIADSRLRPGAQVFAIGDVHGCCAEFERLIAAMAAAAGDCAYLVLLGDLIDRGPDSIGVLALAAGLRDDPRFERFFWLLGNHDLYFQAMYAAGLSADDVLDTRYYWARNGGIKVMEALGTYDPARLRAKLVQAIGGSAVAAFEAGLSHVEIGNLVFVHGGWDPKVPMDEWFSRPKFSSEWLEKPGEGHWAWVRDRFLPHEDAFPGQRFVVHGHTQEAEVLERKMRPTPPCLHQIDGWRLGLDGTGWPVPKITGAQIEDGRYRIFTVDLRLPAPPADAAAVIAGDPAFS